MALTDKQSAVLGTILAEDGSTTQSKIIDNQSGFFTAAQVKGTLVSLASKEMILLNKTEDGDKTVELTGKGREILNPTPEPEVTHWVDVHPRRQKGCTVCDEVEANDIGEVDPIWYDRPAKKAKKASGTKKHNPTIEVSEDLQDPEFYGKLSRKQCLAILAESGYTGPVSYLMPKLRAITEQYGTLTTDMEAEVTGD